MPPSADRVTVPIPPPVLFFGFLLAGWGLDRRYPFPFLTGFAWRMALAVPLLVLAVSILCWALSTMRRNHVSPDFRVAPETLATTGPYRFTRNPLYVALVSTLAGFACLLDSGWLLFMVVALLLALDRLVIPCEERFLADRFGESFGAYRARVRRWL